MCVSIRMQIFALVFSYQGCASVEWINMPQRVEVPKELPSTSEFWARRIDSTDPDEDGNIVYIFRNPKSDRKSDATATCGDGKPQERQVEDGVEVKIVETTFRNSTSFSVACVKPPEIG